ncbi:UTP--glucose-1-phosphate uridylyltransferase GalU [Fredinandcohnia sp. FSL W7-1320]|uniref:UTP--glucose-1-phosphate uridylyltransferase GalU n=1 Tax=Fredinandcohnia sp. FSL W7-1320 TaxID=2954540 RepID=UPI0030FD6261
MSAIKKVIIPAAGLGTRFLPATKAMPKEMLPIVDKPTIQYIVEEAIASGIEDIIIVTGKGKRSIEDHFDHAFELEDNLFKKQKYDLLEEVRQSSKVDIHYIRQKEPRGLGHAIWCARKFVGNEPFGVLLGDDVVQSDIPCLKQLIDVYNELNSSVLGVKLVSEVETNRYGIVDPLDRNGRLFEISNLVEKPKVSEAPSNIAIMGRYILTPDIFEILDEQEVGVGGEIQLTDAIQRLSERQRVFAYEFEGTRYDVGDKLGYIKTSIEFALQRDNLKKELMDYLKQLVMEK